MRCAERVIFAFRPFGETAEATALTKRADAVPPPGQDFVRIALMPDVPDQLVARGVEDGVDGDGQFNHAQPRA